MDEVKKLEEKLKPFGSLLLLGAGRLGFRVFEKLIQVHRGGFKKITVFDGSRIDGKDAYHLSKGARIGEKKVEFLKRLYPVERSYRIVETFGVNFSKEHFHLIKNHDVIVSTIAGGNTLNLVAAVSKEAEKHGIPLITTNGVFGFGDEEVKVEKLQKAGAGPALYLKKLTGTENVFVVGTGKLIKDRLPITPTILESIAEKIAILSLKLLYGRKT